MSYCVLADVQSLITSFTISSSSTVTDSTVTTEIIPEMDQYIDDRLGRYYQTPITGTNALLTMKRIEKYLVAAEIMQRLYIGEAPSDSPQATTWRKLAEDDLTRIVNGDVILWDAQPTGETPEPEYSQVSDKLSVPERQTPPKFSMGMRF